MMSGETRKCVQGTQKRSWAKRFILLDLALTILTVVALHSLSAWAAMPSDVGPHVHTSPAHIRLDGERMTR